jgi:hypothetical protein
MVKQKQQKKSKTSNTLSSIFFIAAKCFLEAKTRAFTIYTQYIQMHLVIYEDSPREKKRMAQTAAKKKT